ncbi:glycerol-3-phosphate O-acyltransferase [Irpex rosettiformis]|uniref:Glycerol-3-phosphate O-acyltransferase n=1 Tax=Irpex rosettiformis TaxID=378272 RepID=A0ACB8UBH7_9APHY|nr:glycerol-3-phosphate O-acyltransferase [Irpex rosettiformis]
MPVKEPTWLGHLIYDLALLFWQTIINIFFREIRPRGAHHIPKDGPVIFVAAPHHNQFLDFLVAVQVYRETGRRISFLVAAKSMSRAFVGFCARLVKSIPVARAADYASPGQGLVSLSEDDPCLVVGHDTRFLSEFTPRMQILLPKSVGSTAAEVTEVISDTQLRVKKEFGGETTGKGTAKIRAKLSELKAEGKEGLQFKKLPHVDQTETFKHVYEALNEGECICIFPEGGSHDRSDLLPLKAGVSLMALGAMANNPSVKVKVVPVGLYYFHPHKFRSRAVVEFGHAMDVDEELVELYKKGGKEKREAVGKLLDVIYDALKTVTIRAPDYETLQVIQVARRLYVTPGQHLTIGQVVEISKRLLIAYDQFKDEPRVQQLKQKVLKYNRLCIDLGLRDHQVPGARKGSWKTLGLLCYRLLLLTVWSVFALPGVILSGPIFLTASIVSKKKAKEALAASNVKIAGRDVLATWKVLISLGLTPLLYTFYSILACIILIRSNAPPSVVIWAPVYVFISLPFIGYAALRFGEAGMDVLKSLRPLVIALVPGQQRSLDELKSMRVQLSNELMEISEEFGPKVFDDFEEKRILVPSASLAPPHTQNSLRRRKTDAQGALLNHPMTWLDEQLFGWSRASSHTSRAWAHDPSSSARPSEPSTPAEELSEDEVGDYDNLLGYLDGQSQRGERSGGVSSFADLQKLKQSGVNGSGLVLNPNLDEDGVDAMRKKK